MTNPQGPSIRLEELALLDDWDTVENNENQITEADIRELSAYGFDSDARTLVGIGNSPASRSSEIDHFDSDDQTLVGIGPTERAERVERERASHPRQAAEMLQSKPALELPVPTASAATEAPESARMPESEPPGPFVASDDEDTLTTLRPRLPMQRGARWTIAVPVLLVAAGALVVVRGILPRATTTEHNEPSAATDAAATNIEAPRATPTETHAPLEASPTGERNDAPNPESAEAPLPPVTTPSAMPPEAVLATPSKRLERPAAALGALDITSDPPSSVVLDGRPLGKAPQSVSIAPGPHTVMFIHPERGRMRLSVNVSSGRTTTAAADF